jgi:hypothetical protein
MRTVGVWGRLVAAASILIGVLSGAASAQSPLGINLDFDFAFPGEPGTGAPAATFGAAAAQPGVWNLVGFGFGPFALVDLAGAPSPVSIARSLNPPASTIDLGLTDDYARLVYDADRIDSTLNYTINGLPAGEYAVYTYAAAPTFLTVSTRITINGNQQTVAGAQNDGLFSLGVTHARHQFIHPGGILTITAARAAINGVVNGLQIVPILPPPPAAFSLIAPANGATAVPLEPTLAWNSAAGAGSYTVTLDDDAGFTPPALFQTTTASTSAVVPPATLNNSTTYFWRVVATNLGGSATATPNPSSFTTLDPPPVSFGLNIDIDVRNVGQPWSGAPSSAFAAAAAQPGTWNAIGTGPGPFPLLALNGSPSLASLSRVAAVPVLTFNQGQTGDYPRLIYDADQIPSTQHYIITGLPAGIYLVFTYAAQPGLAGAVSRVIINGVDAIVSNAPTDGSFLLGATHARHLITHDGTTLIIRIENAGSHALVNGLQIVPYLPSTVSIDAPAPCTVRHGLVNVLGTVAGPGLNSWTLDYTGGAADTWVPLAASNAPVNAALLAAWNTSGLAACGYTLRLRVDDVGGQIERLRSLVLSAVGDVNLDGVVDFTDVTVVLSNFNAIGP